MGTPSSRRRDGRNAFAPGVEPLEVCPYPKDHWSYSYNLVDWLEGWKEAEIAHLKEEAKTEDTFEVYGNFINETGESFGECIGSVDIIKAYGMPPELEIDGYIYKQEL